MGRRAALLAALLAQAFAGRVARAQTAPRLTRAPYVQAPEAGELTILWQTDVPVAPAVQYRPEGVAAGASGTSGTTTATGTPVSERTGASTGGGAEAPWVVAGGGAPARSHAVRLAGLSPGMAYRYRVLAGGAGSASGSGQLLHEGSIARTLPPPEADAVTFAVYGDTRTNQSPHAEVVRALLRERPLPDLLLHAGDFVESGRHAEQWEAFFRIERDLLAQVPLFPAIGNHEDDSPNYFGAFRFPANGTARGAGRWYGFDAGPAHFASLDVVFSDYEPGSEQYRWLDADLAGTDRPWKFVYFHYPPYNAAAPHGPNLRVRRALEHLLVEHRVSIVFASHSHVYERARGAAAGPESPPLVHIVTGGGGAPLHAPARDAWTQHAEAAYHFVRVAVRGDRITTAGVRPDGSEFDRFEGRLDEDGRLAAVTPPGPPVVVPGPDLGQFVRSAQGAMVAGYTGAWTLGAPLGLRAALYTRRKRVLPVPSGAVAPPRARLEDPHADWRGLPVLGVVGALVTAVLLATLPTAPLRWLVGFDAYTVTLTAHAAAGTALLVAAALAGSMGYRLAIHHPPSFAWLSRTAAGTAVLSAVMAVLGNVLYAGYLRSGGPMERLVRKAPEAHKILFEFKEYVGLFPVPLATAAAFVVWHYREDLRRDRHLAELVAVVLLLVAFYVLVPFVLGFAVVRLRGIA